MAVMTIMSDGAGDPLKDTPLLPGELAQLKAILQLGPAKGTRKPPMNTDEHGHPVVKMTLHRPQYSQQPSGPEELMRQLDEVAYGQTANDPAKLVARYGIDPAKFLTPPTAEDGFKVEYHPPPPEGELTPEQEQQLRDMADEKLRQGGLDPEAYRRGEIKRWQPPAPGDAFYFNPPPGGSEMGMEPQLEPIPKPAPTKPYPNV